MLYPCVGLEYTITEWDGSKETVLILDTSDGWVTFQYVHGPAHSVTPNYFAFGLKAFSVQKGQTYYA